MFVINQNNSEVDANDRPSGQKVTSFGRPGSFPGQFNQPHGIAVDSKGNARDPLPHGISLSNGGHT
jgi:hypothetical protein